MVEPCEAADLGGQRAAQRIASEGQTIGELRKATDLGRQRAAELIAGEVQQVELRVLEELGRYRAIEALAFEVQPSAGEGAVANRGIAPADGDSQRAARAREDDERDGARRREIVALHPAIYAILRAFSVSKLVLWPF